MNGNPNSNSFSMLFLLYLFRHTSTETYRPILFFFQVQTIPVQLLIGHWTKKRFLFWFLLFYFLDPSYIQIFFFRFHLRPDIRVLYSDFFPISCWVRTSKFLCWCFSNFTLLFWRLELRLLFCAGVKVPSSYYQHTFKSDSVGTGEQYNLDGRATPNLS